MNDTRSFGALVRRSCKIRITMFRLLVILAVSPFALLGQVPLKPTYGIAPGEFLISANFTRWGSYYDPPGSMRLWDSAHSLGLNVLFANYPPSEVASLVSAPNILATDRLVINGSHGFPKWTTGGFGRQLEFHPFAASQSPYSIWKFMGLSGIGSLNENTIVLGSKITTYAEWSLHPDTVTANTLVAWNPVIDWNTMQVYRYPKEGMVTHNADSVGTMNRWLEIMGYRQSVGVKWQDTQYVVVEGHLRSVPDNSVPDSTRLIGVAIYYEIPEGMTYYTKSGAVTATSNTEILIDSFAVRKDSLRGTPNFNNYRTIAFPFSMSMCKDSTRGPAYLPNESRRFDIRVYYLGHEHVFLRSVKLRDSLGQRMLGTRLVDKRFRDTVVVEAAQFLTSDGTTLRPEVIRLESGTEPDPQEFAGFEEMNKLLRSSFNKGAAVGDSVPAFIYDLGSRAFHGLAAPDEIAVETYLNDPRDTIDGFMSGWNPGWLPSNVYEIPHRVLPSVPARNGGRGHIPILIEDAQGVDDYQTTLQRSYLGKNVSGAWLFGGFAAGLNQGAEISKATGRRLIQVPGIISHVEIRGRAWIDTVTGDTLTQLDTLFSHIPEPAELRAMIGLGASYGFHGVNWWRMVSDRDNAYLGSELGRQWWGYTDCCFGTGLYANVNGDTYDRLDTFLLVGRDGSGASAVRLKIPNMYVGWHTRWEAIKQINRWLSRVGPEMMKLRWRSGYSYHATVVDPEHQRDTTHDTLYRPLADTEIVNSIVTRHPITGVVDSTWKRYVEIGFFYPKGDTQHIVICNRRTYEPIPDTVTDGRDTLAEQREILLQLNLPYGVTDLRLYRVREIAVDTTRLPLSNVPRMGVDTIVSGHSIVNLTLGPGRSALLRIEPTNPPDHVAFGDLRFNGQRKFVFDGSRWHAVYHRRAPNDNTPGEQYQAKVYYRRSYPITPATGGILWEPWEHPISDSLVPTDTTRFINRFPSLTVRTIGIDTVMSVVWTAHYNPLTQQREVVFRNLRYDTTQEVITHTPRVFFQPLESIVLHKGNDARKWGTPVISQLHGGVLMAWSDSLLGVRAILRRLAPTPQWWARWGAAPGSYSSVLAISSNRAGGGIGKYPTVPTYVNMASADSSVTVTWQHELNPNSSVIACARVVQMPVTLTAVPLVLSGTVRDVSQNADVQGFPSMDQTQDHNAVVQEGIVWENYGYGRAIRPPYLGYDAQTWINYQAATQGQKTGPLRRWRVVSEPVTGRIQTAPNIASLNEASTATTADAEPGFSIVANPFNYMGPSYNRHGSMLNIRVPWVTGTTIGPRTFQWGGMNPNGSASRVEQLGTFAALFETFAQQPTTGQLTTTREHFAKTRPQGYVATGREVAFRLDAGRRASISGGILDVWRATDSLARPVPMVERPPALYTVSLPSTVGELMRTEMFTGHDTVVIGCEVHGAFLGDTAYGGTYRVDFFAELVDSITGQVVHRLDSFAVRKTDTLHGAILVDTLDLLSGTYYVRLRYAAASLPSIPLAGESLYPIAELFSVVEEPQGAGKVRRVVDHQAASNRLDVYPNPISVGGELRFSVVEPGDTWLRVYDQTGRMIAEPLARQWMELGRYAIDVDTHGWSAGTYVVELVAGGRRVVEKIIVVR